MSALRRALGPEGRDWIATVIDAEARRAEQMQRGHPDEEGMAQEVALRAHAAANRDMQGPERLENTPQMPGLAKAESAALSVRP